MNRAWIPAGALAGVSVAGLIALGQMTDSLGSQVNFQPTLTVAASPAHKRVVEVSLDLGNTGSTKTASLSKGGRQAPAAPPSGDAGEVGFHRGTPTSSSHTATATVKPTPTPTPKPKTVKRKTSIGADSGPNGDNGLAGGSSGSSTNTGATSGTPAPSAP